MIFSKVDHLAECISDLEASSQCCAIPPEMWSEEVLTDKTPNSNCARMLPVMEITESSRENIVDPTNDEHMNAVSEMNVDTPCGIAKKKNVKNTKENWNAKCKSRNYDQAGEVEATFPRLCCEDNREINGKAC